ARDRAEGHARLGAHEHAGPEALDAAGRPDALARLVEEDQPRLARASQGVDRRDLARPQAELVGQPAREVVAGRQLELASQRLPPGASRLAAPSAPPEHG